MAMGYEQSVWVSHPSLGYTQGHILKDESQTHFVVEAIDGMTQVIPKQSCLPLHPNSLEGVPDLLELGEFSLAALLHNVRTRYSKGQYYSSIGLPILISVNPYKPLPHLYDANTRRRYQSAQLVPLSPPASSRNPIIPHSGGSQGLNPASASQDGNRGGEAMAAGSLVEGDCPSVESSFSGKPNSRRNAPLLFTDHPHLFGTAQMTYTNLITNNQAQSIVVSGESGAGKTEATKILLKYLSELEEGSSTTTTPHHRLGLHRIDNSTPSGVCLGRDNDSSSGTGTSPASSTENMSIEVHALRSNPILEAFGNAKTLRNDNSSRFGKFIQIYFDIHHRRRIRMARISHYLLEKCRLVSLHPMERNFHVFYTLIYGGQRFYSEKLVEWGIADPTPFRQMLGDEMPDANETLLFEELMTCLRSTGFTPSDIDNIFQLTAALLHFSTLSFVENEAARGSTFSDTIPLTTLTNPQKLQIVASLLGITNVPPGQEDGRSALEVFRDIFCWGSVRDATGAGSHVRTKRDAKGAAYLRDAIIKETYSRLFEWLVKKINCTLQSKEEADREQIRQQQMKKQISAMMESLGAGIAPSRLLTTSECSGEANQATRHRAPITCTPPIGLLDIYGFEVFEGRNSFEQLCINYANEKLQQHFNHHVLSLEQKTYKEEGIDWSDIHFTDNKHIIDSLEARADGVFSLVDSATLAPSADDNFLLQEVAAGARHKDVLAVQVAKPSRKRLLLVRHYAGDVEYNVEGFVEKNRDKLSYECAYYFGHASKHPFIRELYPKLAPGFGPRNNSLTATVSLEFRHQLNDLLKLLAVTTPTYVRCIKPNTKKEAHNFDSLEVLRQLKYAGLLESIRIRNSGFGVRCTFEEFLDKYSLLDSTVRQRWRANHKTLSTRDKQQLCKSILSHILLVNSAERSTGPGRTWQSGRTRVFMKEEVQIYLEKSRAHVVAANVIRIQTRWRSYHARTLYQRRLELVLRLQRAIRVRRNRIMARMILERLHVEMAARIKIQRWVRYLLLRRQRLRARRAIIRIQAWWRMITMAARFARIRRDLQLKAESLQSEPAFESPTVRKSPGERWHSPRDLPAQHRSASPLGVQLGSTGAMGTSASTSRHAQSRSQFESGTVCEYGGQMHVSKREVKRKTTGVLIPAELNRLKSRSIIEEHEPKEIRYTLDAIRKQDRELMILRDEREKLQRELVLEQQQNDQLSERTKVMADEIDKREQLLMSLGWRLECEGKLNEKLDDKLRRLTKECWRLEQIVQHTIVPLQNDRLRKVEHECPEVEFLMGYLRANSNNVWQILTVINGFLGELVHDQQNRQLPYAPSNMYDSGPHSLTPGDSCGSPNYPALSDECFPTANSITPVHYGGSTAPAPGRSLYGGPGSSRTIPHSHPHHMHTHIQALPTPPNASTPPRPPPYSYGGASNGPSGFVTLHGPPRAECDVYSTPPLSHRSTASGYYIHQPVESLELSMPLVDLYNRQPPPVDHHLRHYFSADSESSAVRAPYPSNGLPNSVDRRGVPATGAYEYQSRTRPSPLPQPPHTVRQRSSIVTPGSIDPPALNHPTAFLHTGGLHHGRGFSCNIDPSTAYARRPADDPPQSIVRPYGGSVRYSPGHRTMHSVGQTSHRGASTARAYHSITGDPSVGSPSPVSGRQTSAGSCNQPPPPGPGGPYMMLGGRCHGQPQLGSLANPPLSRPAGGGGQRVIQKGIHSGPIPSDLESHASLCPSMSPPPPMPLRRQASMFVGAVSAQSRRPPEVQPMASGSLSSADFLTSTDSDDEH